MRKETKETYSYIIGLVLALAATVLAYALVTRHVFSGEALVVAVVGLAVFQFVAQAVFFLGLGNRNRSGTWNLVVFIFMISVIVIIVGGSLWIMSNLNYLMAPSQVNGYINNQMNMF
ncbi:MAG: cytochrome o ubiquinol oxidase subunit IV [Patescibacteria group bacterium]|nr:cytochrome o ubiquinol oxidase subunit IV [Patescibacteria group bacterium]MDE2144592.1 cytochrome o ubiquinol oxidase subunit IV [Patescibacteria group bacterium]